MVSSIAEASASKEHHSTITVDTCQIFVIFLVGACYNPFVFVTKSDRYFALFSVPDWFAIDAKDRATSAAVPVKNASSQV